MATQITCGYDDSGKFFAEVAGADLAQIVQAPNDLHSELSRRLLGSTVPPTPPANIQSTMPTTEAAEDEGPTPDVPDPDEPPS